MNELIVENYSGAFICKSTFFECRSTCNFLSYHFKNGVYILSGDIDSGAWAFASSLCFSKNSFPNEETVIKFNGINRSLKDMKKISCDLSYQPVNRLKQKFEKSVSKNIAAGLKKNQLDYSLEEIREMFFIDEQRFQRPVYQVGNEFYRCNAAAGYVNGKKIFCFPWFSNRIIDYYSGWLKLLCEALAKLDVIVLLPLASSDGFEEFTIIEFPLQT